MHCNRPMSVRVRSICNLGDYSIVPVLNRVVTSAVVGNVAQGVCACQSYSKLLYCTGEERCKAHKLGLQNFIETTITLSK